MNIFNRVLLVILGFMSLLFWLLVGYSALFAPRQGVAVVQDVTGYLTTNVNLYSQLMVALLAGAFVIASLLLLMAELIPQRPQTVRLPQAHGGVALLSTDAIAQRIKHDVERLAQIREARPVVTSRGKTVDVHLELLTDPESNVTARSEEACQVVRKAIEEGMGVGIGKLAVRIRHEPFRSEAHRPPTSRTQPPGGEQPR